MLKFTVSPHADFLQDLYLRKLKIYKPAPKVPRPTFSLALNLNSFVTSYLLLGGK